MRHRKRKKFGLPKSHREALLKNLLNDLLIHGSLTTLRKRAKMLQGLTDRVITVAKRSDSKMNTIRKLQKFGLREEASRKLLERYLPKFGSKSSGFTTVAPVKYRKGDNALVARVTLLDI